LNPPDMPPENPGISDESKESNESESSSLLSKELPNMPLGALIGTTVVVKFD